VTETEVAARPALRSTAGRAFITVALNVVGGLPVVPLAMYTVPWLQGQFGGTPPDYGDPDFADAAKVTTVLLVFLLAAFVLGNVELQRIATGQRLRWWALALASVLTPLLVSVVHFELTRVR
jgi:hypothetical protein